MKKLKKSNIQVVRILRTDEYRIKRLINLVQIETSSGKYGVGDVISQEDLFEINRRDAIDLTLTVI